MRKLKNRTMLITLIAVVAYVILKIYVLNTPGTSDDLIPDILINLFFKKD